MRSNTSTMLRVGAVTPMALAAAMCFAGVANAATTVNWSCQGTVLGVSQTSSMTTSVDGVAPGSVTAGSPVAITLTPGSSSVPSSASGFTVTNISNLKMIIPVPANSTFVSTSTSGGTVSGSAALVGSDVVLTVPGPISGGSSFTPPAVTINVTANAPGTITSKYAGTSYSSPGMTMTTRVSPGINVATSCYPNPSPTLTTTNVT
uniref:Cyclase n=2 Tax=Mycobacteriaceae TaxID=1762 RepID=V5X5H0_MYCNE